MENSCFLAIQCTAKVFHTKPAPPLTFLKPPPEKKLASGPFSVSGTHGRRCCCSDFWWTHRPFPYPFPDWPGRSMTCPLKFDFNGMTYKLLWGKVLLHRSWVFLSGDTVWAVVTGAKHWTSLLSLSEMGVWHFVSLWVRHLGGECVPEGFPSPLAGTRTTSTRGERALQPTVDRQGGWAMHGRVPASAHTVQGSRSWRMLLV